MAGPEHTDAYSCDLGASCPRARLLAELELLAWYRDRLASDWDARHLVHVGHAAENAAGLAFGPMCGGEHG
ncbi:hypothetical protein LO772_20740 [Yinghuangia sp. ASG 101]|uniref:hypothetical protein n=1 Tax=Yinghuangia sp. ASG 101 TaxID=2896848 RepID=UPI001E634ABF|nr:hypothetical protein [Yinghuangia sp. ASG 101]UGQ09362.1 hypothetical protein LO772_20740 [Yinghuangia sp. ASG 101]